MQPGQGNMWERIRTRIARNKSEGRGTAAQAGIVVVALVGVAMGLLIEAVDAGIMLGIAAGMLAAVFAVRRL